MIFWRGAWMAEHDGTATPAPLAVVLGVMTLMELLVDFWRQESDLKSAEF